MKLTRILLLFLFPCSVLAQDGPLPELPWSADNLNGIVPAGWFLLDSATGDLNGDNIPDLALVVESDSGMVIPDDEDMVSPRILAVYLRRGDGYVLSVQAENVVLRADQGVNFDPWSWIAIDSGALSFGFYTGGAWRWSAGYYFRFQDEGWYLVRANETNYHSVHGDMWSCEYDLVSGEVVITTGNMFGGNCLPCEDCANCAGNGDECGECETYTEVPDIVRRNNIGKTWLPALKEFSPDAFLFPGLEGAD